jgi:hypothetical protein
MAITIDGATPFSLPLRTREGKVFTVPDGTAVLGSDGRLVGHLKEIGLTSIRVERLLRRDIFVPFKFIADVTGEGIVLTIPAENVDRMHWRHHRVI